jgi:hypoxanthine phosphoribosyltransferase
MMLPKHIQEVYQKATCLHTKQEIEKELDRLALEIHDTLSEKSPLLLSVMVGGLVLAGNLLPRLDFPLALDYVHATRYRGNFSGSDLHWKAKPSTPLKDRTILILDDILDQGITLQSIIDYCHAEGAKEVLTAVLLDKHECRLPGGLPEANFVGLAIPDCYVFGYGLDYKEYLRNAPGIFIAAPEHQN